MNKRYIIPFVSLLLLNTSVFADELTLEVGIFYLAEGGADIRASYRAEQSHWQFGYRYVQWTDTFYDPFTGRAHSKTTDKLSGPVINYLFWNESRHSPYIGASLLKWSRTETPLLISAPSGSSSTTDFYFGGGYMGKLGGLWHYNAGVYLSPTAEMSTQTAISSEDQSGNFDIQLQFGFYW